MAIAVIPASDPRLAKLDRLPKDASFYTKMSLLVNWHIARDFKDARNLLTMRSAARREEQRAAEVEQFRLPYVD